MSPVKIVPAEGIERTETLRSGELGACWKQSVQSVRGKSEGSEMKLRMDMEK